MNKSKESEIWWRVIALHESVRKHNAEREKEITEGSREGAGYNGRAENGQTVKG